MNAAASEPATPAPVPAARADVPPASFAVHAYPAALRWLGMAAQGVALGSLLFFTGLLLGDVLAGTQTVEPGPVARGLALGGLLPLVLVALLRRFTRATVAVEAERLVLTLRNGERFEIPHDAVASVRPWWLPLPGPGLTLRLRSGRDFGHRLEVGNPVPLLDALSGHGTADAARAHALVRYAEARHTLGFRRWNSLPLKFGVAPLLLTAVFFRAHQYIAFGGWLGEYQMHGLAAYLTSFGRFWGPVLLSLVLYACFWRALVELLSFGAAWLGPRWARNVRRVSEWFCLLAYYGGLPALVVVRFFLM